MTGKDLFQDIEFIKEDYIVEAEGYKRSVIRNAAFMRGIAAAACLVVCFGLYWGVSKSGESSDATTNNTASVKDAYTEMDGASQMQAGEGFAPEKESTLDIGTAQENSSSETAGGSTNMNHSQEMKEDFFEDRNDSVSASDKLESSVGAETEEFAYLMVTENMSVRQLQSWNAFVDCVEAGKEAQIQIVNDSDAEDVLTRKVCYDGEVFEIETIYAAGDVRRKQETFAYLNTIKKDGIVYVVLSKEEIETPEQLEQAEEVLHLFHYAVQ